MTRQRPDEFYVGYRDETPPSRLARGAALGLLVLAGTLGASMALLLERFDEGTFEYGVVRDYQGDLLVDPHPRLIAEDGPAEGYLLVGVGKRGLDGHAPPVAPWEEAAARKVQLAGTLIRNPEAAMLEVHALDMTRGRAEASVATVRAAPRTFRRPSGKARRGRLSGAIPPRSDDAGRNAWTLGADEPPAETLVGEIVDTKCYLGAMKPGRGRTHRECASLCIRGGIPAALLIRTEADERVLVHLVDFAGQPLGRELLAWVGQPVEVTGRLRRLGDRLFLSVLRSELPEGAIGAATGTGR